MTALKQKIKKITPEWVLGMYRDTSNILEWLMAFGHDKRRFVRYHARRRGGRPNASQLEARLVFHSHAIEKGLSHQKTRLGFGQKALRSLAENMALYEKNGYSLEGEAYKNSLSVISEYVALHEKEDFDIGYLKEIFPLDVLSNAKKDISGLGGVTILNINEKADNKNANFEKLFNGRSSVREYSDQPIDREKINKVIEIAKKTPSICNRQSSRITVIYDKEKIESALKIQGGIAGYGLPPALIMITTDTAAFVDVNERNQIYTDGGLYAMSVLLGLEYVGLAACALNAMMSIKRDKKMRKILNVPPSENIIMFISVGNFLENNKVPKSFRYSSSIVSREM